MVLLMMSLTSGCVMPKSDACTWVTRPPLDAGWEDRWTRGEREWGTALTIEVKRRCR